MLSKNYLNKCPKERVTYDRKSATAQTEISGLAFWLAAVSSNMKEMRPRHRTPRIGIN